MEILKHPDPALRCPATFATYGEDLSSVVSTMWTFIDNRVLGLAANQLGLDKRVAIVNFPRARLVMVNPRVSVRSITQTFDTESCLSMPGLRVVTERPSSIQVTFYTPNWEWQEISAEGYHAKCILHEIDHLDGILMIDREVKHGTRDLQ